MTDKERLELKEQVNQGWLIIADQKKRIEELEAERDRLQQDFSDMTDFRDHWKQRAESLQQVIDDVKWVSIDKDNMEFQATITCWQMDKIQALRSKT